jgi:hypothetical protein
MASAYSSSSSIILSNVLATESCELRTAIDTYMDTKLKEFQDVMKSKVESVITGRLDKFYNKSFEDHDKVLFDKNGLQLINEYNSIVKGALQSHSYTIVQIKSNWPLYPLSTENTNCFTIQYTESINGQGNRISELNYFKTFIIGRDSQPPSQGQHRQWSHQIYKHSISSDCLFAIKYFQIVNCGPSTGITGLGLLEQHPEYFKKNCSEFEGICRREYTEIEKTKKQLKSLMDENISKKDYYVSLDKKLKDFEQEKKQLEEKRQKIKEEKEKMVFIKEKLVEMKKEVELEKQKISEQKSKTIDIDKCFEDIISFNFISEMPKNKVGPKVAYD